MKSITQIHIWWPGLDRDIENLVKSCLACVIVKHMPTSAPLYPWIWPIKPWQRIHKDFAGRFLGNFFVIIVTAHSNWPEVYEMSTTTSKKTIEELRQVFATYGLPLQFVSDNRPQSITAELASFKNQWVYAYWLDSLPSSI